MRLPNYVGSEGTRRFHTGLYEEHLEEASFLYEQRLALVHDPELTWRDLADFEDRLEAHLDALVVGGDLAIDVCHARALEGDFGELYAAFSLFCRQGRRDLVADVLRVLDTDDTERVRAATDALKAEMPDDWMQPLVLACVRGMDGLAPLVAEVARSRRAPDGLALERLNDRLSKPARCAIIDLLGGMREPAGLETLYRALGSDDPDIEAAAARALLRRGEERALRHCLDRAPRRPKLILPLALAGGRPAAKLVRELVAADRAGDGDGLYALGLLGDLSALRLLHERLNEPETAEAAARSLELITGAHLYEDVFQPEIAAEDDLFEDEKETQRPGTPLKRPDGEPYGETIHRLSQNPEQWRDWMGGHRDRFDPQIRYRLGRPYTPAVAFDSLMCEHVPATLRALAYEELTVRHGLGIRFDANDPVGKQLQALEAIRAWAADETATATAGVWSFAGRL